MATQIQTTVGEVVKAYDREIERRIHAINARDQRITARYEYWLSLSWIARLCTPNPLHRDPYYIDWQMYHLEEMRSNRRRFDGLANTTVVLLDADEAAQIRLGGESS
jgi:hypothetical protein